MNTLFSTKTAQAGYSLIELLVVATILAISAVALSVNFGPALVSLDIEAAASEVAASVSKARRAALAGDASTSARTFDLSKAVAYRHNGITISTTVPSSANLCQPCGSLQSICIEGKPFCYSSASQFTFERLSGRTPQPYIIFLSSKNRKLALLISQEGKLEVAELASGKWQTSSQLRMLVQIK